MSAESIWQRIRSRPWTPFGLKTSDGDRYNILHPEIILLSKTAATIAIYDKPTAPGAEQPEHQVCVSPLHVTAVEDMPPRPGNGRTRSRK